MRERARADSEEGIHNKEPQLQREAQESTHRAVTTEDVTEDTKKRRQQSEQQQRN